MPKIFIKIILICIPLILTSQEKVSIKHLSSTINTIGSELNFIRTSENTAFYTSSTLEDEGYQSLIFQTELQNGEWRKGRYFDIDKSYSVANISSQKNSPFFYFSICNNSMHCKIARKNQSTSTIEVLKNKINLTNYTNTQPHNITFNNVNILYFVSNRKGGFGEMDIWFSIIDEFGNHGEPINAGSEINTKFNEITPFYNTWTEELFFSSDRQDSLKGFDIYKSKGSLNLWGDPEEVSELNTKEDELYLSFYNKYLGYFSSNRKPSFSKENTLCCNDIFSFEYDKKDTLVFSFNDTIKKHLPIILYFHNDEPGIKTLDTTTKKTYKDAYVSYYLLKDDYLTINPTKEISLFFEKTLKKNYNQLNSTLNYISNSLKNGRKIELHIKGFASPLYEKEYNINLSKRRIASFINMMSNFENGELNYYIQNGSLKIIKLPFGENKSKNSVSDNPQDKKKSIYSIDAMLERKIEIVEIIEL